MRIMRVEVITRETIPPIYCSESYIQEQTPGCRTTRAMCLQESRDRTDDSNHGCAGGGGSAGELGSSRLCAGGSTGSSRVGGRSSVLGWVGNAGRGADTRGVDGDTDSVAGLNGSNGAWSNRGRGGLDNVRGGVLAVVVNNGGGLGDNVGLAADGEGGGLGADGAQSLVDSGGVHRVWL
jgi:hypothetical protein